MFNLPSLRRSPGAKIVKPGVTTNALRYSATTAPDIRRIADLKGRHSASVSAATSCRRTH